MEGLFDSLAALPGGFVAFLLGCALFVFASFGYFIFWVVKAIFVNPPRLDRPFKGHEYKEKAE